MELCSHSTLVVQGGQNADCTQPEVHVEVHDVKEFKYANKYGT